MTSTRKSGSWAGWMAAGDRVSMGFGDSGLRTPTPPHLDLPSEPITGMPQAAVTRQSTEWATGGHCGRLQGGWVAGSKHSSPAASQGARGWGHCGRRGAPLAWWG